MCLENTEDSNFGKIISRDPRKISVTQTQLLLHFIFLNFLVFRLGILCCVQNIFLGKTVCVILTESLPDLKITPAAAAKCYPLQFVSLPQHSLYIFSYRHSQLNGYKMNFMRT